MSSSFPVWEGGVVLLFLKTAGGETASTAQTACVVWDSSVGGGAYPGEVWTSSGACHITNDHGLSQMIFLAGGDGILMRSASSCTEIADTGGYVYYSGIYTWPSTIVQLGLSEPALMESYR